MGKKHGDKKKKKSTVVLSLAEFNEDAGIGGVDPDLVALPNAPKAAEEWEAIGGRPEYNSRGYKERTPRNYDDGDFDDRDWTRKGPLDAEGSGFGTGPERDWGDMRRGPVDGAGGDQPDRDWNGMRRGPVESQFEGAAAERDWGARKGPVEAEVGNARVIDDSSWGSRKGPVEAEFQTPATDRDWSARKGPVEAEAREPTDRDWSARKGPVEAEAREPTDRDWSARKGPVEAEAREPVKEADWSAPRKGPVESEFANAEQEADRDWTQRKGPVEANISAEKEKPTDWSDVRKGPIEAEAPKPDVAERDWKARRGPVETEVESAQKAMRDVDFGEMRRGAKLEELKAVEQKSTKPRATEAPVARPELEKDKWRRDSVGVAGRRGSQEARVPERPASTGHEAAPTKERDWGAARRSQGIRANPRPNRSSNFRNSDVSDVSEKPAGPETPGGGSTPVAAKEAEADDWTTVRTGQRRSTGSQNRRMQGREGRGGFQRRGLGMRDSKGEMPMRSPLNTEKKSTGSPVTPVASTVSES